MRHTLTIGLVFVVVSAAVGAAKPIPQDHARMEKQYRDRLEWNRRTLQGAYDKIGKQGPRWDKAARETMELAARMFSHQVDPQITSREINQSARPAIDAGCDDPLLVYLYTRSLVGPNYPGEEEATRRMKAAAKALASSRYPAIRREVALNLTLLAEHHRFATVGRGRGPGEGACAVAFREECRSTSHESND